MRESAKLKGADYSILARASDLEALGFLSGEVSLASKPEELLIAIAHRCRKLIIIIKYNRRQCRVAWSGQFLF